MKIEKPNYTQVPNILLDKMFDFTHTEFKVAMFICRQTFGFHREKHRMSLSYIEKGTGLARDTVSNALITCTAKGVFVKTIHGNSFDYCLNLNWFDDEKQIVGDSNQSDIPTKLVGDSDHLLVGDSDTNKERLIKKENKEKADAPICSKEQSEPRSNSQPPNPTPAPPPFPPPLAQAWNEWEKHIRESGRKMSAPTRNKQVEMLSGMDSAQAVRLIEKSILNGWTGLFADKKPSPICSRPFNGF